MAIFPYKYWVFVIFNLSVLIGINAQSKDMWTTLGLVTFRTSYNPEYMMETKIPKISGAVEKIDGTIIEVEGYIIPLTGQISQSHFMLSKFPQSTCFFCGKAGPETAAPPARRGSEGVPAASATASAPSVARFASRPTRRSAESGHLGPWIAGGSQYQGLSGRAGDYYASWEADFIKYHQSDPA